MQRLIFLEFNEINFEYISRYIKQGQLPHFHTFLERHGYTETTSEQTYEQLEPWIQWVTAHTGKSFDEHGVMRLGDIVHHDYEQVWETLEREKGLKVGAVSPMNANNRLSNPAFFVPDPWTATKVSGGALMGKLYDAIAQAVNDNAQSKLTPRSLAYLLIGWLRFASPVHWARYVEYTVHARSKPWSKALFLDLLLTDIFLSAWKQSKPDFSTLFLNAGAHIQHHYMFSSSVYDGPNRNPDWYIRPGEDPLLDVYKLYDHILGRVIALGGDIRIMLATGLHQDPYPTVTYYYRIRHHEDFLRRIGVPFQSVVPRMSRDFHLYCKDAEEAAAAQARLDSARAEGGTPLFEVDNRGNDLFVMLTYPNEITPGFRYVIGNESYDHLDRDVAFVALKNGEHNGIGYFADSGVMKDDLPTRFPLKQIPERIIRAFS